MRTSDRPRAGTELAAEREFANDTDAGLHLQADRPRTGGDLAARLARLPAGHPSAADCGGTAEREGPDEHDVWWRGAASQPDDWWRGERADAAADHGQDGLVGEPDDGSGPAEAGEADPAEYDDGDDAAARPHGADRQPPGARSPGRFADAASGGDFGSPTAAHSPYRPWFSAAAGGDPWFTAHQDL